MEPSIVPPQHTTQVFLNSDSHSTQSCVLSTNPSPPQPLFPFVNKTTKSQRVTPSKFSQWKIKWITDWWGIELVCLTVSVISLAAIVLVLEAYKNKPLPKWPFKLSLNSLICILAIIAQMAMMEPVIECISQLKWLWFVRKERLVDFQAFDNASRGPTGSLMLLGKLRGLHLVTLGASITVCSIAFGPFAQQVVVYPLHSHPTGNASTPLVANLTSGFGTDAISSATMLAAAYNGLASKDSTLLEVAPSCSTGNCTWAEYSSLGVCASVVDISSSILKNPCNQTALDSFFHDVGFKNQGYPCFNYTLPFESVNTMFDADGEFERLIENATLSNVIPLAVETTSPGMQTLSSTSIAGSSNFSFVNAYLIYQPDIEDSINSSLASPIAYSMSLNLCIQTYNTTVLNGNASTVVTSTQLFDTEMFEVMSTPAELGIKGDASITTVSVNDTQFQVGSTAIMALKATLMSSFADNCYSEINQTKAANFNFINYGHVLGFCPSSSLFGLTFLEAFLNSSDPHSVAKRMTQNIATSLTNAFRANTGGNAGIIPFQGTAFSSILFVGTNYIWFIFPVTLISSTLVFLLVTISKSQRLGSRIWKSSNLATLQGLHTDLHSHLGGMSSISDMDEKAESIKVRFDIESKAQQGVEYKLVESKQKNYWKG